MTKKMHLFKSSNQLLTDKTKKLSGDKAQKKASAPKTQDKAMSSVVDEDLITQQEDDADDGGDSQIIDA